MALQYARGKGLTTKKPHRGAIPLSPSNIAAIMRRRAAAKKAKANTIKGSPTMPALNKKKLMREIETERRKQLRSRLAELAELIKAARANRREAVKGVRVQCQLARRKLKTVCDRRAEAARAKGSAKIAERATDIALARETDRTVRRGDTRHRIGVVKARSSSAERAQESDDEVTRNLPPELVGVFAKVRRQVKGGPRRTRTEAFLEWVEENPGEVYALQGAKAERDLARLLAEHERGTRLERRKQLAHDVPF
jgi:hypothetical protein